MYSLFPLVTWHLFWIFSYFTLLFLIQLFNKYFLPGTHYSLLFTRYFSRHSLQLTRQFYSLLTSSSELWASERLRFSTISVELERFELDDVVARSSYGASVSRDELQPRFDRRDALDDDAAVPLAVFVACAAAAAAASAAATADGPLITSSSSSELCWSYMRWAQDDDDDVWWWHIIAAAAMADDSDEHAVSVIGELASVQELKPVEKQQIQYLTKSKQL